MCSYTQVVIVTHRGTVIPCQHLMFRSRQVFFLCFLFRFIQLESHVTTRLTSVTLSSSTILIGVQLFAIHLATVLVNLSQAHLMRGLRCSVRVVWRIPLYARKS